MDQRAIILHYQSCSDHLNNNSQTDSNSLERQLDLLIPMQYKNVFPMHHIKKRKLYSSYNDVPVVGIINGVPEVLLKIFLTSSIKVFVNAGMAGER